MKAPPRLQSLVEEGLIDTVERQLMSGKEAMVFVVRVGEQTLCAKIYKEANNRSFRQAVDYTENRKVKNSRQARAMAKGTRFGRQATEAAWQSAEVDALYRLAAAGVRVPQPHNFCDGVLLMELVTDEQGDAAPRLNDVVFTPTQAHTTFSPHTHNTTNTDTHTETQSLSLTQVRQFPRTHTQPPTFSLSLSSARFNPSRTG